MSRKWDKMDRLAWENSEVMKEFEKNTIELVKKFEALAKKASSLSTLKQESDAAKESIQGAASSVENLGNALDKVNLAEDESAEDEGISDEEYLEAKKDLIAHLTKMAYSAADDGDTILAYKIERAIQEVKEEA